MTLPTREEINYEDEPDVDARDWPTWLNRMARIAVAYRSRELMTRAEWEASMTEEHRIGIEVDVGNGPERPKWKRLVTEWEPDGVVDAAVGEEEQ